MNPKHHPASLVVLAAAFALLACMIWAGASMATHTQSEAPSAPSRVCFPKQDWRGGPVDDQWRPCVRVTRLFEDGSFHVQVQDANGTTRYGFGVGARDR